MNNQELVLKAREHDISDADITALAEVAEVAAEEMTTGYKKIEQGVVTGYKKVETGVVEGFGKVVDKCVEVLFAKEGESVEAAKARLSGSAKEYWHLGGKGNG